MKSIVLLSLLSVLQTACKLDQKENRLPQETIERNMSNDEFKEIIEEIKSSEIYEKPENWEARGLNPSDQTIILLLRTATNEFLDKLERIHFSNESSESKLKLVSDIVDELPWYELDTEEREFMADVLAPAIEAAGFDPWKIY